MAQAAPPCTGSPSDLFLVEERAELQWNRAQAQQALERIGDRDNSIS